MNDVIQPYGRARISNCHFEMPYYYFSKRHMHLSVNSLYYRYFPAPFSAWYEISFPLLFQYVNSEVYILELRRGPRVCWNAWGIKNTHYKGKYCIAGQGFVAQVSVWSCCNRILDNVKDILKSCNWLDGVHLCPVVWKLRNVWLLPGLFRQTTWRLNVITWRLVWTKQPCSNPAV
jgi:hypothetical protein